MNRKQSHKEGDYCYKIIFIHLPFSAFLLYSYFLHFVKNFKVNEPNNKNQVKPHSSSIFEFIHGVTKMGNK